jgi:hypothetical protein
LRAGERVCRVRVWDLADELGLPRDDGLALGNAVRRRLAVELEQSREFA